MSPRARRQIMAAAALGGAVLFVYAVQSVGWGDIAAGIRRVGWGLLPILGLAGFRFVLRAECWRRCMPPDARISLKQAFTAFLAGDAIGNVTPLGLVASESTKVVLIQHRLATREAVSSLAVDVFLYTASVAVMIGIGLAALVLTVPLPVGWPAAIVMAIAAIAAVAAGVWRLRHGMWDEERGTRPPWRARLASLREAVLALSAGRSVRLWGVFLLHFAFHAAAFLEVYLALGWLLGDRPTLTEALIFSALDRVVVVVFKFVPFRVGVDEASSGGMALLLGWDPATGVALAIVKKVRSLVWVGVGLLLIAAHPARTAPALDRRETEPVRRI